MSDTSKLTKLGHSSAYTFDNPTAKILEIIQNQHTDVDYLVPLIMRDVEFSSLCPMTGQPDWAKIHVFYIPDQFLVESKSIKMYFGAFRNHGEFHEDCVNRIMKDIYETIKPKWIRVIGDFNDRGGIAIKPLTVKLNPKFIDQKSDFLELVNQFDQMGLN
jgi:7-cyano-7-deazaguanine reductase